MATLWLTCLAAMALGLWIDTRVTPATLLASECGAPGGLLDMAWRHGALMPASSAAMALAALAPWPAGRMSAPPLAQRLLCAFAMAIGMVLGARLGVTAALLLGASPFGGMALGMAAGMAVGLVPVAVFSAARR
ncbi:hypothetical protein [Achromobacter sp. Bel]|uniref:hypothetical protein n=1 Tax=Achromobacter sp. Bel TaxID=2727415 RepID=UPI00145DB6AB|nr:hypothetical protein [Achromobacter sp. Bel]NMK48854.1 hypothetical protein [Achromobacter sp. Bel]